LTFETLEIGDYLSGDVAIERKSWDFLDFKRLKTQAIILKNTYGNKGFLVIEHNLDEIILQSKSTFKDDKTKQILGMVASLSIREGLVPIFASCPEYAAYIIKSLCEKGNDGKVVNIKVSRPRQSHSDKTIHMLCGIPGVDEVIAQRLIDKFGTVRNIANASFEDIMTVEGIGEKKAKNVYKVMNYGFFGNKNEL
jgi:DNA excision repair protein ERCC-4